MVPAFLSLSFPCSMEKLEASGVEVPQSPEPQLQTILSCTHSCPRPVFHLLHLWCLSHLSQDPSQEAHSVHCLLPPFAWALNVSIKRPEVISVTLESSLFHPFLPFTARFPGSICQSLGRNLWRRLLLCSQGNTKQGLSWEWGSRDWRFKWETVWCNPLGESGSTYICIVDAGSLLEIQRKCDP